MSLYTEERNEGIISIVNYTQYRYNVYAIISNNLCGNCPNYQYLKTTKIIKFMNRRLKSKQNSTFSLNFSKQTRMTTRRNLFFRLPALDDGSDHHVDATKIFRNNDYFFKAEDQKMSIEQAQINLQSQPSSIDKESQIEEMQKRKNTKKGKSKMRKRLKSISQKNEKFIDNCICSEPKDGTKKLISQSQQQKKKQKQFKESLAPRIQSYINTYSIKRRRNGVATKICKKKKGERTKTKQKQKKRGTLAELKQQLASTVNAPIICDMFLTRHLDRQMETSKSRISFTQRRTMLRVVRKNFIAVQKQKLLKNSQVLRQQQEEQLINNLPLIFSAISPKKASRLKNRQYDV